LAFFATALARSFTRSSAAVYQAPIRKLHQPGEKTLSPQEKRLRVIRQIVIFGIVLIAFLGFAAYRIKTGNFG